MRRESSQHLVDVSKNHSPLKVLVFCVHYGAGACQFNGYLAVSYVGLALVVISKLRISSDGLVIVVILGVEWKEPF